MACWCENVRRMQDIVLMRKLAQKSAKLDNKVYIIYEKSSGVFDFVPEGEGYDGKLIEYVYPFFENEGT